MRARIAVVHTLPRWGQIVDTTSYHRPEDETPMNNHPIERDITAPFTIDGKTYDLGGLARIHRTWTPMMWTTEEPYRIGDAEFLPVCGSPPLHRPGKARAHLNSRPGAMDAAIKMNAPDDVIERPGVVLKEWPESPEKSDRDRDEILLLAACHSNPFFYNCLYLNYDGSYVNKKLISLESLP